MTARYLLCFAVILTVVTYSHQAAIGGQDSVPLEPKTEVLADDTGDDVATEEQNNEDDEAGMFSYLRSALTELGEGMGQMIDYAETRMGLLEENTELETTPDADAVQDTEAK